MFRCVPGKDISLEDFMIYLEGLIGNDRPPPERANKFRPIITGFFNFFSTETYRRENLIIGGVDFVKFWAIQADVEEQHCKEMLIKCVPSPVTIASLLGDFVTLVSNNEPWHYNNWRLFAILKQKPKRC